jgi:hypothetical protein
MAMTTKEQIRAELDRLSDDQLNELLKVVTQLSSSGTEKPVKEGLLDCLRRVQIDGPEDFASNFDQYVSGENSIARGRDVRSHPVRPSA